MNIEQELRSLQIEFPPEPDLVPRLRGRLERPSRRPWLILALAGAAALGALLAIPQTRAAIFDLFRIGGVEVRRVETQPQAPERDPDLGRRVTFAEASDAVEFPLLAPDTSVRHLRRSDGHRRSGQRALGRPRALPVAGRAARVRAEAARARLAHRVPERERGAGAVDHRARHEIIYRGPDGQVVPKSRRLVGNVLLWDRNGITYRLEGARTQAEALAAVRNLKAP